MLGFGWGFRPVSFVLKKMGECVVAVCQEDERSECDWTKSR